MSTNLQPGDNLRDRYQIVGLIGTGGMGAVYLARDIRLTGRQCAVKETLFSPTLNDKIIESARKQFYQEASILAQLDHPGLPKVSDYFSIDEHDYLVMDYIPGNNLLEILAQAQRESRFLDVDMVLEWVEQICDTLVFLHSRQPTVLHRDLKPSNIKLTPDGRIKVVDFGLVKPLDPNDPSTLTGFRGMGSVPYAPLEQYLDHLGHTDARSDLYALGATIYHLLTGHVPVSAQERFLAPELLPLPQTINPSIPPVIAEVVLKAMSPHPKDRPTSIVIWRQMLHSSAVTMSIKANDDSPQSNWLTWENRLLMAVAVIMFVTAVWITF